MTTHEPTATVIDIEFTLPAPPERVFAALTAPADVNAWMWGNLGPDPQADIDLRPGGMFDISIAAKPEDDPTGETRFSMRGVYVEVDPPRRLSYSLRWFAPVGYNEGDDVPFDEIVVITLQPAKDNTTTMHYRHIGVPDEASAREHDKAIRYTFDMLAVHLRE